jgi:hypothetical protein
MDAPRFDLAQDPKGWLAFRSKFEHRRTPIPDRWEELSDTGLRALLSGARPSRPMRQAGNEAPDACYSEAGALKEATGLAATALFAKFSAAFDRFVDTGLGELEIIVCGRAVALEMRRRGLPPERVLRALRVTNSRRPRIAPRDNPGARIDTRVTRATELFLAEFFRS